MYTSKKMEKYMKKHISMLIMAVSIGLLVSGCTYKRTATSQSTHLDGTKVDYSKMDKYIKAKTCYNVTKTGDASLSILEASKKVGITKIVYVDKTITSNIVCVVVYGE